MKASSTHSALFAEAWERGDDKGLSHVGRYLEEQEAVLLREGFSFRFVHSSSARDQWSGAGEGGGALTDLCSRSALLPTRVMTMLGLANC
jgi:hypothetical protein